MIKKTMMLQAAQQHAVTLSTNVNKGGYRILLPRRLIKIVSQKINASHGRANIYSEEDPEKKAEVKLEVNPRSSNSIFWAQSTTQNGAAFAVGTALLSLSKHFQHPADSPTELNFLIPTSQAALLIGKRGHLVQVLRSRPDMAKTIVMRQNAPSSEERVVRLVGTITAIKNTFVEIASILPFEPIPTYYRRFHPGTKLEDRFQLWGGVDEPRAPTSKYTRHTAAVLDPASPDVLQSPEDIVPRRGRLDSEARDSLRSPIPQSFRRGENQATQLISQSPMNADSVTAGRRMERLSNSSDTRDFTDLRVTIPQDSAGVRHKGMRTSSPDPKKGALPAITAQKRIADENQKAGPSHRIEAMDTESARRPN